MWQWMTYSSSARTQTVLGKSVDNVILYAQIDDIGQLRKLSHIESVTFCSTADTIVYQPYYGRACTVLLQLSWSAIFFFIEKL